MILSQFLPSNYTNSSSTNSADVMARVSQTMQAQNTGAPQLNAALSADNITLSGLGKLLSALTSFQSVAKEFSATGVATSATTQDPAQITKNVTSLVSQYNAT